MIKSIQSYPSDPSFQEEIVLYEQAIMATIPRVATHTLKLFVKVDTLTN